MGFFFRFLLLLCIFAAGTAIEAQQSHRRRTQIRDLTTSEQDSLETQFSSKPDSIPPTTFFEITRPIFLPPNAVRHSTLVLQHDFGYTYGKPAVTASYTPPSHTSNIVPAKIVLEWSATCKGRQYDRIFGIWVAGVEILRSCTAEPTSTGIIWNVKKDVTRYHSLLSKKQTMSVYLANIVDTKYTGVYHVNVSIHFYYAEKDGGSLRSVEDQSPPGFGAPADLILPISRNPPLNDGLWFLVMNSTDIESKNVTIPANTYRAVLEIYISYHSSDEFWYLNPPNSYISSNNLTGTPGNGPFREVKASIDGNLVGVVWPFTVIYTGGIDPLLWRPISGIGSFDLPTYDIEITPFLGKLLNGKPHRFGFSVTNALDVWYIDANLHLWIDKNSKQTTGSLIRTKPTTPTVISSLTPNSKSGDGLDGSFSTTAWRELSSTGWVNSSHGNITTEYYQNLNYTNLMVFTANGTTQQVNQTIDSNWGVKTKNYSLQVFQRFPLYLLDGTENVDKHQYTAISNISFGFNEKRYVGGKLVSGVENNQNGDAVMIVEGNIVKEGVGATDQKYFYENRINGCYSRIVSSRNYSILHDDEGTMCRSWDLRRTLLQR